ncbi:MAG: AAA family ATPase, partial [Gemmataceae bacterium]|nr:AAA family ATPase [Gemmataceae bacterium]
MKSDIARLLELARSGQPDPFQQLIATLRQAADDAPVLLLDALNSPDEILRRAALAAATGRTEPDLLAAVSALAHDPSLTVRQALAYALGDAPAWPLDHLAEQLLLDHDPQVRQSAVWAARRRPALELALVRRLAEDTNAWVRLDIATALGEAHARTALPALLTRLAEDPDGGVQQACSDALERHLNNQGGYPADLARPPLPLLADARRRVLALPPGLYNTLIRWLDGQLVAFVDAEQLGQFGAVLTREAESGQLEHAYGVDPIVQKVLAVLRGAPPRAVVLVGESGSGKTAIVHELTHHLARDPDGPCHVLRMAPSEFLAGTTYIGEWETKVRNLVNAIRAPRRVVLYVPNLEELAWMGTWAKSDASVASALAPHVERGEVTILGESSVEAFRKGLGANRSLRRLFHAIEVQPATPRETRDVLQAVVDEASSDVPENVLDRLGELADFYAGGTVQPGRSVGLLRRVLSATAGRSGPVSERDVLNTISASTGIPVSFLDDSEALDRAKVRAFFEARVMGQPEAVDAVVDLVTLVKAGLTDPGKPFGVLLFVGPTGVGKTELARALAEMLFGDPARLVRLDMSEFATYEAFERLIGQGVRSTEPGLLTAAVRERPFAVLLFDEIEKAHPNIYNLCLQIFDAGRLTDTAGRTTDFRRTIIILTSNVGSAFPVEGSVGFGQPVARSPDREATLRELGRWFRPEFLNRLDRIVTFRPLEVETAEKIARREVTRVLERSGIARRRLAVDVAAEVLPLLLREGYSPAFGARPLKRTVERLVLLPVARAIAAGEVPAGSLLRLVARGGRVDIEVAPPEPPEPAEPHAADRAVPVAERAAALLEQVRALHVRAAPLAARKSELLAQSAAPGFWDDPNGSWRLLDEVYRIDSILAALDRLEERARAEAEWADQHRASDRDLARVDEHLDGLEGEARHVEFLVGCRDARALGDAYVTLHRVASHGAALEAVPLLARMYVGLAKRRGLEADALDDRQGGDPAEDTVTLLVSGAGAYALLAGESGLHQVSRGRREVRSGRRRPVDREVVRVEVLPVPVGETDFGHDEVRVEVRSLGAARGRLLARVKHDVLLFHVESLTSVRAWMDGSKAEALQRLRPYLRARVEASRTSGSETARPPLVRRYTLGPT